MKIIGSDYDGTLSHGGIDDAKRQAIADWRAAGNIFSIVSGRSSYSLYLAQDVDRVGFDYFIAYNGGMILNEKGEILFERSCTTLSAKRLLKDLFYKWGFTYAHVFVDRHYVVKRDKADLKEGDILLEELDDFPYFYQFSIMQKPEEQTRRAVRKIRRKYGLHVTPLQNGCCIDIVPRGINKAQGLRTLAWLLEVDKRNVIAVGDNVNDMAMIKAFRSYAMENGVDKLKKMADEITPSVTTLIRRELAGDTDNTNNTNV